MPIKFVRSFKNWLKKTTYLISLLRTGIWQKHFRLKSCLNVYFKSSWKNLDLEFLPLPLQPVSVANGHLNHYNHPYINLHINVNTPTLFNAETFRMMVAVKIKIGTLGSLELVPWKKGSNLMSKSQGESKDSLGFTFHSWRSINSLIRAPTVDFWQSRIVAAHHCNAALYSASYLPWRPWLNLLVSVT